MRKKKLFYISAAALLTAAVILLSLPRIFMLSGAKGPLSNRTFSRAFYDKDGKLLRLSLSHDDKYRLFVPLSEMPESLKESVLLYEDKYFYYHYGFNPVALAKGFWISFVKKTRPVGASTITMQTARILYDLDTRTVGGKIKQIIRAVWMEMRYTKKQILEAYLNLAPYAYNIEGAGAASLIYFNTRTQNLTPLESLTLAVIPQNPTARKPSSEAGFNAMNRARKGLFNKWAGKNKERRALAHFFDLPMAITDPSHLPFHAPHLVFYLEPRERTSEVFTTIDLETQKNFEAQIKNYIDRKKSIGIKNASALLLNYKTMEVEAAVGSADFWDDEIQGQVNGFNSKRLIGSTLKPFIYAMAVEKGLIHPGTLLKDTKKYFGVFSPENSDKAYAGPLLAKDALVRSRNIPTIDLLIDVGQDNFVNLLKNGGVKGLKSGAHYGIGLAIGSFEVSLKETAALYAALAGYGAYRDVRFTKNAPEQTPKQILTPEAAFIALDMLKSNPRPYSKIKIASSKDFPVYFKTGTSSSFKDAWSAGVFGDYVLVVWVGNFNGEGNNSFWGRTAATPLFFELITAAAKNKKDFNPAALSRDHLKIIETDICKGTGDLPGKYCPSTEKTLFIPGVSPIKVSEVHRLVYIDKATGLRACKYAPETTRGEVYEFWPSEIDKLFKEAGIVHRAPPGYVPGCEIEDTAATGHAPVIVLPAKEVVYPFIEADMERAIIPLRADTDAGAEKVFWFKNNLFIAETEKGKTAFMKPESGTFTIRAVDDLGRSNAIQLTMTLEPQRQ